MKKWSLGLKISLIALIICAILCGIFNSDDTRVIWEVARVLLVASIVAGIVTMIGCIMTSIKNKEKMPIWICVIMGIIIAIGIIGILGSSAKNDFKKKSEQYVEDYAGQIPSAEQILGNAKNNDDLKKKILDKWNVTLPLNNTNGLECAVYNMQDEELYLKYNFGICVIDSNNTVNRYVKDDNRYPIIYLKIKNAEENSNTNYEYMTATEFKEIIK